MNKALEILNIVLEKEPENIRALLIKGFILSRLGRHEEAIECCNAILN